jgi:phosphoribosylanthranilate isomerase
VTRVKICGISEFEHGAAALEYGADLLGFVFYRPSHRYVTPAAAAKLVGNLRAKYRSGWKAVGLFVDESVELVEAVCAEAALDLAQLAGNESLEYCRRIRVPFLKVIRPVGAPAQAVEHSLHSHWGAERVLLDASVAGRYGGTGQALDWAAIRPLASDCLLAGGLTPDNVGQAIRLASPWGVDVSSGVEVDRRKNVRLIERFLHEVHSVDASVGAGAAS